jgi:hypothetical protein
MAVVQGRQSKTRIHTAIFWLKWLSNSTTVQIKKTSHSKKFIIKMKTTYQLSYSINDLWNNFKMIMTQSERYKLEKKLYYYL